jgi:hypothetical protein
MCVTTCGIGDGEIPSSRNIAKLEQFIRCPNKSYMYIVLEYTVSLKTNSDINFTCKFILRYVHE